MESARDISSPRRKISGFRREISVMCQRSPANLWIDRSGRIDRFEVAAPESLPAYGVRRRILERETPMRGEGMLAAGPGGFEPDGRPTEANSAAATARGN
jgi:hypothetical protein